MSESFLDIRDRLRPRLVWPNLPGQVTVEQAIAEVEAETSAQPEVPTGTSTPESAEVAKISGGAHAFAVESQDTGKIVVTVPATRETALASAEDFLLRLSGRLVEAERANLNGAFWSSGDLEFGLPSVAMGPLNWLHQERKVVGVLSSAQLVRPGELASSTSFGGTGAHMTTTTNLVHGTGVNGRALASLGNPYIRADALVWKWLYPVEAREVERASDARQLWYSMECVSRQIECVGDNGCGKVVPYRERSSENACSHMRERSAQRRLVDPIFQGAAIIVPPVKPGWADADLAVTRQAAALVEDQNLELGLSTSDAERMVAQVLAYANEPG